MHAASRRLGVPRGAALLAAVAIMVAPAIVFFASVVELHGLFFGFTGIAALATARFAEGPSWLRGAVLGLSVVLAYLAHATGSLLPAILLPLAVLHAPQKLAARKGLATTDTGLVGRFLHGAVSGPVVLAAATAVVGCAFAPWLMTVLGLPMDRGHQVALLDNQRLAAAFTSTGLPRTALVEWVRPFLAISVLGPLGLAVAQGRAFGVALVLGLLVYLPAAFVILGDDCERGAYLLPLAWPAACAAAMAFPRLLGLGIPLALFVAVHDVREHEGGAHEGAIAAGISAATSGRPAVVYFGAVDELGAGLIHLPSYEFKHWIDESKLAPETARRLSPLLALHLRSVLGAGRLVLVTDSAREMLADADPRKGGLAGPVILAQLERDFVWRDASRAGFHGFELLAR